MERKKEFAVLADALSKTSITKINAVCRLILKERIETELIPITKLQFVQITKY